LLVERYEQEHYPITAADAGSVVRFLVESDSRRPQRKSSERKHQDRLSFHFSQPQILTLWHLVVSIADETNPKNQWETVTAGVDTLFR
jgi:hypothetical protein